MNLRTYDDTDLGWELAFSDCRELNAPMRVQIGEQSGTVFPSGSWKPDRRFGSPVRASAEPRTCRLCGRRFADHTGVEYCSIACEGLYRIVELIRG